MKCKAIIFGSTGMIGKGVLLECLDNDGIESVLVINRHSCNVSHRKLREIIHSDYFDVTPLTHDFAGYNACFFCLGVSSAGMSEKGYHHITYDLTVHVATTLLQANRDMKICYISGAQTDSSEQGKVMWARVKGKTENALLAMPFTKSYMFRPGYIQPMRGIKSRTALYNLFYVIFKPLYGILKHFEKYVTNSETLAKAMIYAVTRDYEKSIVESKDINEMVKEIKN